jgi:hypothetical protein
MRYRVLGYHSATIALRLDSSTYSRPSLPLSGVTLFLSPLSLANW